MKQKILATIITGVGLFSASVCAQELTISDDTSGTADDCVVPLRSSSTLEFDANGVKVEISGNPEACLNDKSLGGGAVALSATPYKDIEAGSSIELSWAVPPEHNCQLTRNGVTILGDSSIDSDSDSKIQQTVDADSTYRMDCSLNIDDTDGYRQGVQSAYATAIVDVAGTNGGGGGGQGELCQQQLDGFNRVPSVNIFNVDGKTAKDYEDAFDIWGAASNTAHIEMGHDKYVSLPFMITSERPDNSATIIWEEVQRSPESVRMSVSTCISAPMQVNALPQAQGDSCYLQSNGRIGGFSMKVEGSGGASLECILQPNTQYFLNIGWIDANGDPGCSNTIQGCVLNAQEN